MGHLTVAILNYNGADTLYESIWSVLAQTRKPDRFVVIDNASTDESYLIAEKLGVEIVWEDNRAQFITGLNAAMRLNQDRLFFMQNDVLLEYDCLKKMSAILFPENFIAQPLIVDKFGEIDNCGMDIYWPGYGFRRNKKWWKESVEPCGLVTTICFLTDLKKQRYSERFKPAYYEDLSFKLEYPEVSHLLVSTARAMHKGNHTFSQTMKKNQISQLCHKNRIILVKRHYEGLDKIIRLLAINIMDGMYACVRKLFSCFIRQ